jgi:uncharacterized iron-regulated membrane protein
MMKWGAALTVLWLATTLAVLAVHHPESAGYLWTQAILGQVSAAAWSIKALIATLTNESAGDKGDDDRRR